MATTFATVNSRIGKVRRETLNGRSYLVAPFVSLVPGVLPGSKGPLYYPPDEIAANPGMWNGIPLTLGHPSDPITNQPQSAREPDVLDRVQLGQVFKDHVTNDGRRVGEAWFDEEWTRSRAREVYNRLSKAEKGHRVPPLELSTGLYTDNEPATSNSHGADYVARNYRPDHLAILPNAKGACSVSDGCGVILNQVDLQQVKSDLTTNLSVTRSAPVTLEKLDDGLLIFNQAGKSYRQAYQLTQNDEPELVGEPEEVQLVEEYQTVVDGNTPAELIVSLLHVATAAHLMHLQTDSIAVHLATQEVYEQLPKLVDRLAESWQGKNEIIAKYPGGFVPPEAEPAEFFAAVLEMLESRRAILGDDSSLQNTADEIASLLSGALYKLRFLS